MCWALKLPMVSGGIFSNCSGLMPLNAPGWRCCIWSGLKFSISSGLIFDMWPALRSASSRGSGREKEKNLGIDLLPT